MFANSRPVITPVLAKPGLEHKEGHRAGSADPGVDDTSISAHVTPQSQPQELQTPLEPLISPVSSEKTRSECSVCEDTLPKSLWFCGVCKLAYCDSCWEMQATHRVKLKALVPTPHEKTPLDIAEKVGKVLAPTEDVQRREALHREDENTAWFGKYLGYLPSPVMNIANVHYATHLNLNHWVRRLTKEIGIERLSDSSPLLLQDYGRLNDFLDDWEAKKDPHTSSPRTPSLVSFVGQTGAGKSSLVKLLIDFASNDKDPNYSTPVIGSRTDHLPTSEDVHLYLDPRTASTNRPILFADCEGLDGGDREPVGARLKLRFRKEDEQAARNNDDFFKRKRVLYDCPLQWSMKSGKARSRGFAVTHVYPRLLYAFSDVIVYVLMNHR